MTKTSLFSQFIHNKKLPLILILNSFLCSILLNLLPGLIFEIELFFKIVSVEDFTIQGGNNLLVRYSWVYNFINLVNILLFIIIILASLLAIFHIFKRFFLE